MSDYEKLWEYTQKCEAHIKQLEAKLARVNGAISECLRLPPERIDEMPYILRLVKGEGKG